MGFHNYAYSFAFITPSDNKFCIIIIIVLTPMALKFDKCLIEWIGMSVLCSVHHLKKVHTHSHLLTNIAWSDIFKLLSLATWKLFSSQQSTA